MKLTKIAAQIKRPNRYSLFIDDNYSFSLSGDALLETKLVVGQELEAAEITALKRRSDDDAIYGAALKYAVLRPRSVHEMKTYLTKKDCPAPLIEQITNKLIGLDLVNDQKFAASFVHDRLAFRPTSRRKILVELSQKHIDRSIGQEIMENIAVAEPDVLRGIIASKRKQTRYRDDVKLMRYLSAQGFSYQDIKAALHDFADN